MTGKIGKIVGSPFSFMVVVTPWSALLFALLFALLLSALSFLVVHPVFAADHPADNDHESMGDDIVVIVSSLNSVKMLTREHVADIFLGRMQQFPDEQRASPIDQAEGSDVRERFNMEVLGRSSAQVRAHWSRILFTGRGRPPRSVASNEDMVQAVAADVHAIGYIQRRFVNGSVVVVFE